MRIIFCLCKAFLLTAQSFCCCFCSLHDGDTGSETPSSQAHVPHVSESGPCCCPFCHSVARVSHTSQQAEGLQCTERTPLLMKSLSGTLAELQPRLETQHLMQQRGQRPVRIIFCLCKACLLTAQTFCCCCKHTVTHLSLDTMQQGPACMATR